MQPTAILRLSVLIGSLLSSCTYDKEARIRQKIEASTSAFRTKKLQECRENLLAAAERRADSLLLEEARQLLRDSLTYHKPFRPLQPPDILPIDSAAVEPIFQL
jgi:hypothetical protein